MKTFYNKDEDYVNEMLEGIINAHLNLLKKVNGEIRAIARADAPIKSKVSIVTGGGSGHLPVFMGYIGKGLLDGAADENNRRGVAGLFYAYKVAGACADKRGSLEEVDQTTKEALKNIRSLGVAISPCTVPGAEKPSFTLKDSEMEIGMGIHGEAGIKREERKSADEVTEDMMRLLFEDLPLEKGNEVSVLVNSLGATPLEELYIIFRKVSQILQGKNIKIYKPFIGRYATSLEMAGFSITLFKLNEKYKEYLDHPVWTPFVKEG